MYENFTQFYSTQSCVKFNNKREEVEIKENRNIYDKLRKREKCVLGSIMWKYVKYIILYWVGLILKITRII